MKSLAVSICIGSLVGLVLCLSGCEDNPTDSDGVIPGTNWRLVESGIQYTIRSMAANDTLLIGVGDYSTIYCTSDGRAWMPSVADGLNEHLAGAAWSGTQFVVVGSFGTVVTSPDAVQWTRQNTGSSIHLQAVACSDTLIVAVGNIGVVLTSTDGINWTLQPQIGVTTLHDVLYDGQLWITCGTNGKIYYSTDAVNWIEQSAEIPTNMFFRALEKASNGYFAVGILERGGGVDASAVYTSSTGYEWSLGTMFEATRLQDIYWTGQELLVAGYQQLSEPATPPSLLLTSPDGSTWTEIGTESPHNLEAIGMIASNLVITGSRGYVLSGGESTELEITESGAQMTDVVWAVNRFVAVTVQGTAMTSRNGEEWQEYHSHATNYFSRLVYDGWRFVAIGGYRSTSVYTSTDALEWTLTWGAGSDNFIDAIWAGEQFVVIGRHGSVLLSSDGVNWEEHTLGDTAQLYSLCWDGERYTAVGAKRVFFSRTGRTWESRELVIPDNAHLKHVTVNRSRYVAVGFATDSPFTWQRNAYTSADGVTWMKHYFGSYTQLNDLVWTGSIFVTCGGSGRLMTSRNGSDWTTANTGTSAALLSIIAAPRKILVVGQNRTVLASP